MIRFRLAIAALASVAVGHAQTRPHNFDLMDVRWTVSLDEPTASMTGDVTNTLRPDAGARTIRLDFGSMKVDSVTVDGERAEYTHTAPTLIINLPKRPDGKKPVAVRIQYHGQPKSGVYFVPANRAYPAKTPVVYTQGEMVDTRFWLPTYDHPDDKATSEGTIDVPESWYALSNGRLVERTAANGRARYHWKMDQPHVTYLISFAAGPYEEGRQEWDGIPVNYYVPQGLKEWGEVSFGMTPDIVRFFSKITGFRYPYAKYAQSAVPDFMFGGMENITATTQTINTLHPRSVEPIHDSTGLVAHELAHQWFGDTVTCSGWSDAWINEGWASMMPLFYFREKQGQDVFDIGRYDTYQGGLGAHREKPNRPVVWKGYKNPIDMFDGFIYAGGASRMLMLMREVGEVRFWAATKAYLEERKYTSFDTPAFFETWSKNLKHDLKPFMQQWFYTAGAPRLTVSNQGSSLVVTQQKPYFSLDLPVWVWDNGQWNRKRIPIRGERSTLDLGPLAGRPALLDPECWLMGEITNKIPIPAAELMAMFRAAPNAGEQVRMIDTMLTPLSADQRLELAKSITSKNLLRRFVGLLQEGSQEYLLGLTKDSDRALASTALGKLGDLQATPAVRARVQEMADSDPNDSIRQQAFRMILMKSNQAPLADQAWTRDGFHDGYRRIALDWWAGQQPDVARERALEAIEKGMPEPTRVHAIGMLGRVKDKPGERRVYDTLARLLQEPSFGARNTAIGALATYGDKSAIPLIQPFATAELVFFRNTAEDALRRLGAR